MPTPRAAKPFLFSCLALTFFSATARAETDAHPPFEPHASYVVETLANLDGGHRTGAIFEGLLNVSARLDLAHFVHWPGGTFFVNMLVPHGEGLTANDTRDLNVVSNIDAYDGPRLDEIWIEQQLGSAATLRAGILAADAEFFLSKCDSTFVNSAFGTPPLVSLNVPAPVYPVAAPGLRLSVAATNAITLLAGIFEGQPGSPDRLNKHGTLVRLNSSDGALLLLEADGKWHQQPDSRGLPGNYKLGGFLDTANFSDKSGHGSHHGDCGIYCVCEQQVTRETADKDQGLWLFGRLGVAPEDRNLVPFNFDAGINYIGLLPARDADVFGLGVSYVKISPDYFDETIAPGEVAHHETILEMTYAISLRHDQVKLQPDFQFIDNPGATRRANSAWVAGLRLTMTF